MSHLFPPILRGRRMVTWHPLLEWRRAHSRRMETLTSSPPRVKNGEFSEKFSPQASYFSPAGLHSPFSTLHSPFSEKATKGCHTFLHIEAILLAPLFPHSPFSENPFSNLREGVTTPTMAIQVERLCDLSGQTLFRVQRNELKMHSQ